MASRKSDLVTSILALLMILEIAAVAAAAGYFILTGHITAEQVRLAWQVYQGEVTDETVAGAEKWQQYQIEKRAEEEKIASGADAREKLAAANVETEMQRLGLLREYKLVQDQRVLLQQQMEALERRRQGLEDLQKQIDQKIALHQQTGEQQSFQAMVGIVKSMQPAQIKDYLVQQDENTVAAVLKALGNRLAAKVLEEFRTPAEIEMARRYLDTIRGSTGVDDTPTAAAAGRP